MRQARLVCLLVLCAPLAGCGKLSERDVREFVDRSDATTRKRFAPEICALRGASFRLHQVFQGADERMPPTELEIDRRTYCAEAGKFARIRQYRLERTLLEVDLAADRKTARITAEYVETLPFYEPDVTPSTPDDFREFQILKSREESVVGIEDGDVVFLKSDARIRQTRVPKNSVDLPYT